MKRTFMVNKVPYDENYTCGIFDSSKFSLLEFPKKFNDQQVRLFKDNMSKPKYNKLLISYIYGRHQTVKTYRLRNWIWVFSNYKAVIYLLINAEGKTWEYDTRFNVDNCRLLKEQVQKYLLQNLSIIGKPL